MLTASYFRSQARKCRALADATMDERTAQTLRAMALEYGHKAKFLETQEKPE